MATMPAPLSQAEIDELDELVRESSPVRKVNYTHDALIDLIIANPGASQGQLARMIGYTQPWVCTVMSSDAFKARLNARRAEVIDPVLVATVKERMDALANRSVEVLLEKLSGPISTIDNNLALKAAELGAKSLGMGVAQTSVKVGISTSIDLGEAIREGHARRQALIEGEILSGEQAPKAA